MQRAILVGANLNNDPEFEYDMDELKGLAEACEMEIAGMVTQNISAAAGATYIGKGKVQEVAAAAEELGADTVLFDNALSPSQQRNLQKEIGLPVMDRTYLILQIFSGRARTKEARLQVESASLHYMLPRLSGMGEILSRQGGGAAAGRGAGAAGGLANRGAGETQLELDRRKIEKRLTELDKELEAIDRERRTQQAQRKKSELPSAALVGYTNAGKSTLMNLMLDACMDVEELLPDEEADSDHSGKKVFEKDMLFATLDTTIRRISPGDHRDFLLSDTVGFINHLPHSLIKAFRSTLAEACSADLLLIVVDFSDIHYREQMRVTEETLKDLGAGDIPRIYVMNKSDLVMEEKDLPKINGDKIYMSAKLGLGLGELLRMIRECLFSDYVACTMLIPYTEGAAVTYLKEHASVSSTEYLPEGTQLQLVCRKSDAGRYEKYIQRT